MAIPVITDVYNALNQTIFGPSYDIGNSDGSRIPFIFTSKKRLASLSNIATTSALQAQSTTTPILSTSTDQPIIKMAINPHTVSWKQPKRITRKDTMDGAVFFHFSNDKGQDNDIITLELNGVTGNIDTNKLDLNDRYGQINYSKLLIWHELYKLTREQVVYLDSNNNRVPNEFYIIYTTKLFPSGIKLTGLYNKVLDFSENADSPNMRSYSLSFIVTDTTPSLDDIASDIKNAVNTTQSVANLNKTK
jgi:hypothetical protein